ncbi:MAG TPA: hypothetical protein VFB06_00380 [Streptosporangiaceae bacterium]|nr:hypothetical protein [Streptosporangiaceae bacterium]
MLSYASDFWPLFWIIVGSGAVLTALICLLVATFSPSWFKRHGQHAPLIRLHQPPKPAQTRKAA